MDLLRIRQMMGTKKVVKEGRPTIMVAAAGTQVVIQIITEEVAALVVVEAQVQLPRHTSLNHTRLTSTM